MSNFTDKLRTFFTVPDKWTSLDKVAHFAIMGLFPAYVIGYQTGSAWLGLGAGLLIGVFKEIVDAAGNGTASVKDLAATWAGAAAGALVSYLHLTAGGGA